MTKLIRILFLLLPDQSGHKPAPITESSLLQDSTARFAKAGSVQLASYTSKPVEELLLNNGQLWQPHNSTVVWKLVKAGD